MRQVYQAGTLLDLYQLAEKPIDLEDSFRQWRFRHVTTVGASSVSNPARAEPRVGYLRSMLDTILFPNCGGPFQPVVPDEAQHPPAPQSLPAPPPAAHSCRKAP